MDITWAERLDLFRYAILAALLAGAVCPLVGAFLYVRRTSFYGVTLPQFAAAGIVLGFVALPWWSADAWPCRLARCWSPGSIPAWIRRRRTCRP